MKQLKEVNPVFTFWIENKISQERKFFASDIRQLFQKWLVNKKDVEWIKYYGAESVIQSFIAAKDGLNSAFEISELEELIRLLKPDYKNIISGINPVTKLPL